MKSSGDPRNVPSEFEFTKISKSLFITSSIIADFISPLYSICIVTFPSPTYPPKYVYAVLDEEAKDARVENPVADDELPPIPEMICLSVKMFSASSKGVMFWDARRVVPNQIPMFSVGEIVDKASSARRIAMDMFVT